MPKYYKLDSWTSVLTLARAGGPLYYQAPLDLCPAYVDVVRVFKNNKIRVQGPELTFTCDDGHLDRFRLRGATQPITPDEIEG